MKSGVESMIMKRIASAFISLCMTLSLVSACLPKSVRIHAEDSICKSNYADCIEVYTPGKSSYRIHHATSFNKFISLVNSGTDFEGVTIYIDRNINPATIRLTAPVGTAEHPFNGTFEGNGWSVLNATHSDSSLTYNGLFGYIGEKGVVRELNLVSSTFTGGEYCGGIAGRCDGIIENCTVKNVSVSGTKYAGGIAGYSVGGFINSFSTGTVSLTGEGGYAGGVAGWLEGNLFNSYSTCTVSGSGNSICGGMAGYLGGTAVNCYASGNVSGKNASSCGGFAAVMASSADNCYAAGTVTAGAESIIAGFAADIRADIHNAYWNTTATADGVASSTSGVSLPIGKTAAELSSPDMVALLNTRAMNIVNALGFTEDSDSINGGFPVFSANVAGFAGGDGSETSPYLIASEAHLHLFINLVNTQNSKYGSLYYKMVSDIMLDSSAKNNIQSVGEWDGFASPTTMFHGVFDGGGYTISGINISKPNSTAAFSLFTALGEKACVKNLNISDAKIQSYFHCGLIAAINYGTIQNCTVSGSASAAMASAGGIAGSNYGKIINCISTADLLSLFSGEIAGGNLENGIIANCFAAGSVEQSDSAVCWENRSVNEINAITGNYFLQTDTINAGKYGISIDIWQGDCSNIGAEPISEALMNGTETYGDTGMTIAQLLNLGAAADPSLLRWTNDENGFLCFDYPQISYNCTYGSFTSNTANPLPGSEIRLMPAAEEYFVHDSGSFAVINALDGSDIKYTENSDGSFTFTMPQSDISVSAVFRLGGDGTQSAPFELYTAQNIKFMAQQVNAGLYRSAHYKLMENIYYTPALSGEFLSIGTQSSSFSGIFDGNGKAIANLIVSKTVRNGDYFGFFGYVTGTVRNLSISANISLTGESTASMLTAGGISAHLMGGTIDNCTFLGAVNVSGGTIAVDAGGIAGTTSGKIINCSNAARISSTGNAGGIAGSGGNCVIWNCYNRGQISLSVNGGGILGYASDDAIENCYSCASVSGEYTGGIAGYSEETTLFSSCYYSESLFDGSGVYYYQNSETGISAMTTEAIKTKTFALELQYHSENPILDSVSAITHMPSAWMQNSVTAAGCPAFLRQAVNVVSNSVTNIEYWDIQDAVNASMGEELTLLVSSAPSYTLNNPSGSSLSINFSGKTLTCPITNSGTMLLSNGTANSDITNNGTLELENITISGSGGINGSGTLTIGGSTKVNGGISLQTGFVGVSSELTSDFVANLTCDGFIGGYQAVKGIGFTLIDGLESKFSVSGGYALGLSKAENALIILSSPSLSVTQDTPSVYDALPLEEGADFKISTQSDGDISYSYCVGTSYDPSTVWTAGLPVNAGIYTIRAEAEADPANHYITATGYGIVEISKRPLTITADDQAVVYLDPIPRYTASVTGFAGTDDLSSVSGSIAFSCAYTQGSIAGQYTITPDISALSSSNYILTAKNGMLTVSKLLLNVSFVDYDGSMLSSQVVEYGYSAAAPPNPERTGYTFTGWSAPFDNITADLTITALYTINAFTVSFVDLDGTVLSTQIIEYGKSAVAPPNPERTGYTFTGWSTSFDNITADLTITALYAVNTFTVSFVDFDGTVLSTQIIEYGKSAVAPENPAHIGYTFTGWSASFDNITADLTITALYAVNAFTVSFVDFDGTVLSTQIIEYGKSAVAPENPAHIGYTFTGWSAPFDYIVSDLTINALYDVIKYTVNFLDYDGTILSTQYVEYAAAAQAPEIPQRTGYTFTGWNRDFSSITESVNIVAEYTVNLCTVSFYDYDNTLLEVQEVEYGRAAIAPADPLRTGYTFTGWDADITAVTHDLTVTAVYTINIYTVTFKDYDGTILSVQEVKYGLDAIPPQTSVRTGYSFVDWNRSYKNVSADITVTAVYETLPDKTLYTVTFVDYDDTIIAIFEAEYWSSAEAPEEPYRKGYTFIGWDKDFTFISENMTVRAVYEKNIASASFTVIFRNYDGKILSTQNVESGKSAQAPENPERYGYKFIGWDRDFSNITSYLTVTAQYELVSDEILFTVTFKDYDGTVLSKETVRYMGDAAVPDIPEREGYNFTGWDKSYTGITDNITITAQYEPIKFIVVFFDYDGTLLGEQTVPYGSTAILPEEPIREGYTFIGWDTDFSRVTEELSVTALYKINTYTVTFFDFDSTVLDIQTVEYGGSAKAPAAPVRANHTFAGWSADFSYITSSLSVSARYKINTFTVVFADYDGSVISTQIINYGSGAAAPEVTPPEGFVFAGWDRDFSSVTADMTITAQYTPLSGGDAYKVTFIGMDGSVIAIRYVEEGKSAEAPEPPEIKGYAFTGWDKDFSAVYSEISVTALYRLDSPGMIFTVVFLDYDGTVLDTQHVKSGDAADMPAVPVRTGYAFAGWDKDFTAVVSDITVRARYTVAYYTVIFKDYNGDTLSEQLIPYGGAPEEPDAPVREGYIFKGWDISFGHITGDTVVKAVYTVEIPGAYTVIFIGFDGVILKTEYLMDGESAVAPELKEIEGYEFIGWDIAYDSIFSDTTVKAIYKIRTFKVTFCDYNGSIISVQNVEYGKSAATPASPSRTGYKFTGWDKTFSSIAQDITVTAVYQIKVYNVVFLDADGIILSVQQIEHGGSANPPEAPGVEGMTFVGWDTSFRNVTASLTIQALYTLDDTDGKITVIFRNYDTTILDIQYIDYGNDAIAPAVPQRSGYKFIGWDKGYEGVTRNVEVTALYEEISLPLYTVKFLDYNGKVLSTQSVRQGMAAVAPVSPQRTGYTFTGWSAGYSEINTHTEITALYTVNKYHVVFRSYDGTILSTQTVEYSQSAQEPSPLPRTGYTFSGWSAAFLSVAADLDITALYTINTYTVTFLGFGGTVLKTQKVAYLKDASAPTPPAVAAYDFIRWDTAFSSVTGDITINAVYARAKLLVTFCDYDNTIISQQYVEYGLDAVAPEDPQRTGYTFTGWDMNFTSVTSDILITANYTLNRYTIRFLNWDGTVLSQRTVSYLGSALAPSNPSRTGYSFVGWDSTFDVIVSDMDIYALYSPLIYTVRFADFNGTIISIQYIEYGQSAAAPEPPVVLGYTFTGWSGDFTNISQNIIVNALYTESIFTVTFVDWDGTVLSTEQVNYGEGAAEPDVPDRRGYNFSGWDMDFTSVTEDISVNALYSIKFYAVKFYSADEILIDTVYTAYGTAAQAPEAPKLDGQYFTGWSGSIDFITEAVSVYALYNIMPVTSITIPDTDALLGEMVSIPVNIDCPHEFESLTLNFQWNSDIFTLMGCRSDLPFTTQKTEGGIIITLTPEEIYTGSGRILTLDFFVDDIYDAALLDSLSIAITEVSGVDSGGNNLIFSFASGKVIPDRISYSAGDVNLDGVLDESDALLILQWSAYSGNPDATQLYLSDVNRDGIITPADALQILLISAEAVQT